MLVLALSFLIRLLLTNHTLAIERTSRASPFAVSRDHALIGHVMETIQSIDKFRCAVFCMRKQECLSANFYSEAESCELNRQRRGTSNDLEYIECQGCFYMEKQTVSCLSNPCLNNGVCHYGADMETFICTCLIGYRGAKCEEEVIGYKIDRPALSCKQIYDQEPFSPSGVYYFKNVTGSSSTPYQGYCYMDFIDNCGGGGWSLAMKIDGNKTTFHFNSTYWMNTRSYNPAAGKTGFDTMETKLPFYYSMPVNKLCLGMRIGQVTRWIAMRFSANSLYDIISTNTFHRVSTTALKQWRSLVPGSSLQTNSIRKGFNAKAQLPERVSINSRARIGVVGNNEGDVLTPDSRIGFGTGGSGRNEDDTNSCGNEAAYGIGSDNGKVSIRAFCYILLQ